MTDQELWQSLEGIHAYDEGARDSGIRDEPLRSRCIAMLATMSEDHIRLSLSRFLRDVYLSDEALAQGYGYEDVAGFVRWFVDDLGTLG